MFLWENSKDSGNSGSDNFYITFTVNFSQRMILSMLAVLLLFALINGLLVYSIIKDSDSTSVENFNEILQTDGDETMDSWLNIAYAIVHPYVILSRREPDSTEIYKNKVASSLKEIHWWRSNYEFYRNTDKKYSGFYFILNSKTGEAVLFMDSLGNVTQPGKSILEVEDVNGKKFAKEMIDKAVSKDFSSTKFKYFKPGASSPPVEGLAKSIYIEDWDWVVATGSYSDKINRVAEFFTKKFKDSRLKLIGNLFGIMLVSFLVGLFMIFRQMNSFVVPLNNLSTYLHKLASEGIRFGDFNMDLNSQEELKTLAADINALIRNVGSFIDNVRISADKVSDLSGSCTDMLDIVDYDAKLVGQRTVEMSVYSEDVIDNVNGMAVGIEEIYINLDGLKKLTSHIAENTTDIKNSILQMSESMKELNEKSHYMQNSVISVTQAVNDIGLSTDKELDKINAIDKFSEDLLNELHTIAVQIGDVRKYLTLTKESASHTKEICDTVDGLFNKISSIQVMFTNLHSEQITSFAQIIAERKKLSEKIYSDTLDLNNSIGGVATRITEINSNSQYINSNVKYMSGDINEAYRNLEEIVSSTDTMNEHAKQAIFRMDEFSLKLKRVEEAHSAIEHTMVDAKDSMKSLNDLSANLRKVVDDLVRLENKI
ncbi:MAG: methyl-accepting chemotaxis protein [Fibromonadaceae bacterium]|nr:methyl-accepting chemotaxis protein [Fibromonadaceae bacterium]